MPETASTPETEKTGTPAPGTPASAAPAPAMAHPQNQELEDLKELARIYGVRILVFTAVGALAAGGLVYYQNNRKNMIEEASARLGQARQVQDLEAVAAQYPETPSAPLAILQLAKAYFDNGDFDMALNKYTEFEQKFPGHALSPAAIMGRLHCMEARLQLNEALAGFQDFIGKYPDHFLKKQ